MRNSNVIIASLPLGFMRDDILVRQPIASGGHSDYSPTMENKIAKIETRLDGVEQRLIGVECRLDGVEKGLDSVRTEVSNLRLWIMGAVLSIAAIVIAFGAYLATWFQHSLDRNWEQSQKSLDKIDATNLRMERMDAEKKQVRSPHP